MIKGNNFRSHYRTAVICLFDRFLHVIKISLKESSIFWKQLGHSFTGWEFTRGNLRGWEFSRSEFTREEFTRGNFPYTICMTLMKVNNFHLCRLGRSKSQIYK